MCLVSVSRHCSLSAFKSIAIADDAQHTKQHFEHRQHPKNQCNSGGQEALLGLLLQQHKAHGLKTAVIKWCTQHSHLLSCTYKIRMMLCSNISKKDSGLSTALTTHHLCSRASCAVARLSGSRVSRLLSRSKPASDSVRPSKSNLLTGNLLSRFGVQAGNLNCKTKQLIESIQAPHKVQHKSHHAIDLDQL